MSIADRVEARHEEVMKEHARHMTSWRRLLILYFIFCALVVASSMILLLQPPPGFAPPESFTFSGHYLYQLFLFIGSILGFTVLFAYSFVLMSRQVLISKRLVGVISTLLTKLGSRGN